jgi:hypothetical protein
MDNIQIQIEMEKSPASNNALSIFVQLLINNKKMNDILDIDAFFDLLINQGASPLFTCTCGNFGCSGYYVQILHQDKGILLKNSYYPDAQWNREKVIEKFEYFICWNNVNHIAKKLLRFLNQVVKQYPHFEIYSGVFGLNLVEKIPLYKEYIFKLNK